MRYCTADMIRAPPGRQSHHRQLRTSHALSLCRKQYHTFVPASGHMVGHIETETVPHNRVKKRRGYAARAAYYHARKISALLVRVLARRVSGLAGAPGLAGAAAFTGLILWHVANTHNAVLSIQKVFSEKPQAGSPAGQARQNLISSVCGRAYGIPGPATAMRPTASLGNRCPAVRRLRQERPAWLRITRPNLRHIRISWAICMYTKKD